MTDDTRRELASGLRNQKAGHLFAVNLPVGHHPHDLLARIALVVFAGE